MLATLQAINSALICKNAAEKVRLTSLIPDRPSGSMADGVVSPKSADIPGHPEKPELVPPTKVARRRLGSENGRKALMHSVAHIEFNAINLALDMALRFGTAETFSDPDDQRTFIADWIIVAKDEARHFSMIEAYLNNHDCRYGHFPAHNGLWEAAQATNTDVAARLAIAPMVLEARGLDVTPHIIEKMRKVGDMEAVEILEVILEEEVAHVAFGTKWFNYFAEIRNQVPETYFQELVRSNYKGKLKQPLNVKARFEAGLYEDFYFPLL